MTYQWKEQVVLITGGAAGIGAEVVKAVLEEGAKHVAILDIDETAGMALQIALNSKYGTKKVKFYHCDVTDEELFLGIFETVKEEFGYIEVVINNSAIMNDKLNIYKKQIEVNVTALVTGTLKAIEIMRKDKGGRGGTVINISSIAALIQSPIMPIYYATKSAVLQFSNCIGMDEYYSRTGVRVLAICFGATNTTLLSPHKVGSFDPDFEDNLFEILKKFPTQSPKSAAKGVVDAYKNGKSGTTWLIDVNKSAQDISTDVKKAYKIMSSKMS